MRRGSGSETDQGEGLDDCCYVTSALGTLCSESHIITFLQLSKISKIDDSQALDMLYKKLSNEVKD